MKALRSAVASVFGGRGKESGGGNEFILDRSIAELDYASTFQLTRQTMALSRRRRCGGEHLGADPTEERMLPVLLGSWYMENGFDEQSMLYQMQSDLNAISNNPTRVSDALKRRVLLTRYFSRTGQLEDVYGYGDIEPFVFESEVAGRVGLRDTFQDRLTFPRRVETVISFDPDAKGHKHQIKYFRALLASYAIAQYLRFSGVKDPNLDVFLTDEQLLARGWLSLARKMQQFSLDPFKLPQDDSLLYNKSKVSESAMLFNRFAEISEELLIT